MTGEFGYNFPNVPVQCAAVEDSDFFGRTFDGVVAWGLFFLLSAEVQLKLIEKVAAILPSGGRLLFTAPSQPCYWLDAMPEKTTILLGHDADRLSPSAEDMPPVGKHVDQHQNYHTPALT